MKHIMISLILGTVFSSCSLLPMNAETITKIQGAEDAVLDDLKIDVKSALSKTPKP
jgi:hypothetical protein